MFGSAKNHGKKFRKYSQTSVSGIVNWMFTGASSLSKPPWINNCKRVSKDFWECYDLFLIFYLTHVWPVTRQGRFLSLIWTLALMMVMTKWCEKNIRTLHRQNKSFESTVPVTDANLFIKKYILSSIFSRVDKCTGWRWYYVCPKWWLKTATSCQCLSPKSGFFNFCCSPIEVGFSSSKLAYAPGMSTFVPCFRLFLFYCFGFLYRHIIDTDRSS